jgi:hypothetical protein
MSRHYQKDKEAKDMTGLVCQKIKKKVEKNMELAANIFASGVIRPYCITILYYNLLLFIDIFHI